MSFGQAISIVFKKYTEFPGRAPRSEFWWWIVFTTLVSMLLTSIPTPVWTITDQGQLALTMTTALASMWAIAVLLPTLAVTVRRLRDAGYGWGHLFWVLLPIAGAIVLIVLCAQPTRLAVQGVAPQASYEPTTR
ncbi:DUF805 domain-containing protein [Microbacterium sp. B2969]|uniref:DUF805 domain-containing protein n=1 Tax=Microbacterium alkaliflavum TaxID=3248839 RepID=A0ABW7Q634_9MICO